MTQNQLVVYEWLKSSRGKYSPFHAISLLQRRDDDECGIFTVASFECLTDIEQLEVILEFSAWSLNK